ncbi:MAG TPA: hypothetical protein VIL20_17220 [Sandaracinaceae bacterium]
MLRRARALGVALALLACEQGGGTPAITVEIVDGEGANPVAGCDGTIEVRVRHMGEVLSCGGERCIAEIRDGPYALDVPLETLEGMNEVQVAIEGECGAWIGAAPPFQVYGEGVDTTGLVRFVVGPPGRCVRLGLSGLVHDGPPRIAPARSHAAAVVRRNVALVAGGELPGGGSDDVDRFDMLLFDADPLPSWDGERIGRARGLALSEDRSLVVGDVSSWIFERADFQQPRPRRFALHDGAGFSSALVAVAGGAAVVGGSASREVTWVGVEGSDEGRSVLRVRRDAPAAAAIGGGVLVVGGHAAGEAALEWVRRGAESVAIDAPLPEGRGGVLFSSPDGRDALWIGFEVAGAPSADTYYLRGCGDGACDEVRLGPPWEAPRRDFAHVITQEGTLWLVGGERDGEGATADVDRLRWDGGTVVIESDVALDAPRAGAAIFEHASGIVTVVGGRAGEPRNDAEMCFPPALDPL